MTKAPGNEAGGQGEAGFVLPSVLLAAMLFAAVGASVAVKSRISAMRAANQTAAAKAGAVVERRSARRSPTPYSGTRRLERNEWTLLHLPG